MKYPSPEYSALVERKQNEIRGNVSSVKMTPQECEAEIKEMTGGSFEGKGGEIFDYSISPDGKTVTIKGTDRGAKYVTDGPHQLPEAIQPNKRGRPKGSRNRPKI